MKFLICICLLSVFGSLTALPVNTHRQDDVQQQPLKLHPYHSGLIKDYNSHQKFEYKFTELQVVSQSPNQHQSLPLTINELNDQPFDDQLNNNKFDNNLSEENRQSIEERSSTTAAVAKKTPDAPSAVLSDLFTRVNKRYMNSNSKRKDKLRSSARKQQERVLFDHNHDQHEVCPESSVKSVDLDAVSKAYLAPILFSGKLSSLSEDYTGRISATFQVLRVIKTSTVDVKDQFGETHKVPIQLEKGHQVVLHFVSQPGQRFIPPHCAVFMKSSSIGSLRLEQKYFVYAAAPVQSLQEMHRHSFGSVTYKAETTNNEELVNATSDFNTMSNSITGNTSGLMMNDAPLLNESMMNESFSNESSDSFSPKIETTLSKKTKMQNLVWMNEQHYQLPSKSKDNLTQPIEQQAQIPMQYIVHYLSAFYAPEPFSKNVSKSISKTLCKNCAKKPQVEGFNGDVRVQAKNKLRLRCKIFGSYGTEMVKSYVIKDAFQLRTLKNSQS